MPDAAAWLERKKSICAEAGLTAISPLDPLATEPSQWIDLPEWRRIALRNETHIRSCDAVVANVTPFRGPSADAGTIYEIGYARGIGRPVFAYATTRMPFLQRTRIALKDVTHRDDTGAWRDSDGMEVEQFGLFDNLMIEAAIVGSGTDIVRHDADRWRDLSAFHDCVRGVVSQFSETTRGD
jgi:nucleoside 2-deoxyribosyltransferase